MNTIIAMAQQGEFWNGIKHALERILDTVKSHYEETKRADPHYEETKRADQHRMDRGLQVAGNDEEEVEQQLQEIVPGEAPVLDQGGVPWRNKGQKTAKLIGRYLEEVFGMDWMHGELVGDQTYGVASEDLSDDRKFENTILSGDDRKFENTEMLDDKKIREGIT